MRKSLYVVTISIILMFVSNFFFNFVNAVPIESNPNWNIHFENIQIS